MRTTLAIAVVAAGLGGGWWFWARGDGPMLKGDNLAVLSDAALRSAQSGGVRVHIEQSEIVEGSQEPVHVEIDGVADIPGARMRGTETYPDGRMELLELRTATYLRPLTPGLRLPAGKAWARLERAEAGTADVEKVRLALGGLALMTDLDRTVTRYGVEWMDRVQAEHFITFIPADETDPTGTSSRVDAWVGKDRRLVRLEVTLNNRPEWTAFSVDFSGYGTRIPDMTPPPIEQVVSSDGFDFPRQAA